MESVTYTQPEPDLYLVHKPGGISSFDVIRKLKRELGIKKMGHAGTLDPMATGLMIILTNSGTKRFDEFQQYRKTYIAEITFGATTDSYDAVGNITWEYPDEFTITDDMILEVLPEFIGEITQIPPIYSALKINGKRAYMLARSGVDIKMLPRQTTIYSATMLGTTPTTVTIEFVVSSGTYIRSLAYDIGQRLGFGAYLSKLKRTSIGDYLNPEN